MSSFWVPTTYLHSIVAHYSVFTIFRANGYTWFMEWLTQTSTCRTPWFLLTIWWLTTFHFNNRYKQQIRFTMLRISCSESLATVLPEWGTLPGWDETTSVCFSLNVSGPVFCQGKASSCLTNQSWNPGIFISSDFAPSALKRSQYVKFNPVNTRSVKSK